MTNAEAADSSRASRVEIVAAVLLAAAAVATAWSSYQASRWTGEQAKAFASANAARVESTRASDLANAQSEIDVTTFSQWVDAYLQGNDEIAAFYERRFREEFRPAFHAWLRTDPFDDRSAPDSPFAMSEYVLAASAQADALDAEAESTAARARDDVQRATNYVLGVVLFAVSLFFAGISTKLTNHRIQGAVVGVGCAIFLVAAAWIATFPISLSV
jgi:hypothetical protein